MGLCDHERSGEIYMLQCNAQGLPCCICLTWALIGSCCAHFGGPGRAEAGGSFSDGFGISLVRWPRPAVRQVSLRIQGIFESRSQTARTLLFGSLLNPKHLSQRVLIPHYLGSRPQNPQKVYVFEAQVSSSGVSTL